ncbi:hypothetical protein KUCAC02_023306, partial [Chaenocephalus aceratus]
MVTAAVKWIKQQPVQQACRLIGTAVQLVQQAVSQATSKHTAGGRHGNTDCEHAPESSPTTEGLSICPFQHLGEIPKRVRDVHLPRSPPPSSFLPPAAI